MPKLTFEDSLRKVALQALLPGLEMAYQVLGAELHRVRLALGIPEDRPIPPAESPEPEEEPQQRKPIAPAWTAKGKFDQPILDYIASHGGVMVLAEFNKHYKIGTKTGEAKTVSSTIHRLVAARIVERTGPGIYRLIAQSSQPKKTGMTDAQKKRLSRVAKQRWSNMSAAARKKQQEIIQAGRAKARAARVRAAKTEAAQEPPEEPAA